MTSLNERGHREVLSTLVVTRNRIARRISILETRKMEAETELDEAHMLIALCDQLIENIKTALTLEKKDEM